MKTTLHAQASAVDVASVQATRRGSPGMKAREWEMLEPRLKAACRTLLLLDASRHLPGIAQFIAEIEG